MCNTINGLFGCGGGWWWRADHTQESIEDTTPTIVGEDEATSKQTKASRKRTAKPAETPQKVSLHVHVAAVFNRVTRACTSSAYMTNLFLYITNSEETSKGCSRLYNGGPLPSQGFNSTSNFRLPNRGTVCIAQPLLYICMYFFLKTQY